MKEVDATGCIVAPGAIDLHNHYDLQLNWDPYATMSGWHGVTSVAIGQCGFGFAPCKPKDQEAAMRLLTRIEAIPLSTMEKGLPWDWESFPQWMDSLAKRPLGVNVGALVPFNPLRLYVMGIEESRERVHATEAETHQMQALVHEAMKAGAFGWSSMKTLINRPDDGRFIPSQVASNEEYLALAQVLSDFGVGSIGWTRGAAERPRANTTRAAFFCAAPKIGVGRNSVIVRHRAARYKLAPRAGGSLRARGCNVFAEEWRRYTGQDQGLPTFRQRALHE